MNYETVQQILSTKHKGSFIRVSWKTEPTLSASAKKAGHRVEKFVESTVRWGIKYDHIKAVINRKAETVEMGEHWTPNENYKPWWKWEVPNVFKSHLSNENKYLTLATVPYNHNAKIRYYFNSIEVTKEELIQLNIVTPSYWSDNKVNEVFDLNVQNIINIK